MPSPLISIVVVCRNPGPQLRDALASVWAQRGVECELVVVDGGSTDGTVEWLGGTRSQMAACLTEPDVGVYDAMNKGVLLARGQWVLFLGADDRLAQDDVLARAAATLAGTKAGVLVGEAAYDDGRVYRFAGVNNAVRRNFVHHQAAFYRRTLFADHQGFDRDLRVMGDYDFNLRLVQRGVAFTGLAFRVAVCGSGGLSDAGAWAGYREEIAVRHRYFPASVCWLWDLGSAVRYLRKRILRRPARHRPE
ncbi:MAG TPA: glycosyltransferase family 2 protein [Candidatus Didemnitutus sp.]|nr:glycosyltransferase family 2 protein [Candidatus Didemnitutus sp.]